MKRALYAACGILVCTAYLTGCQPTPEKAFVVGKGNGTIASAAPEKTYEKENHWTEEFQSRTKDFDIYVDADINDQDFDKADKYQVTKRLFTKEEILKLAQVLCNGNQLYDNHAIPEEMPSFYSKEWIERRYLYRKSLESRIESGSYAEEDYNIFIEKAEQDMKTAWSADKIRQYPFKYENLPIEAEETYYVENGTDCFDYIYICNIYYRPEGYPMAISFSYSKDTLDMYDETTEHSQTEPAKGMKTSREEAIQKGDELLKKLGLEEYELQSCNVTDQVVENYFYIEEKEEDNLKQRYTLRYAQKVDGVAINSVTRNNDLTPDDYNESMDPEALVIHISDDGIQEFEWKNPCTITKVSDNEGVLLPMDEIKQKFRDYMLQSQHEGVVGSVREVHIDNIRLGWMQIREKDSRDFELAPVWDFYGYNVIETADGKREKEAAGNYSQLTVNAIDGSIMHRNQGY